MVVNLLLVCGYNTTEGGTACSPRWITEGPPFRPYPNLFCGFRSHLPWVEQPQRSLFQMQTLKVP